MRACCKNLGMQVATVSRRGGGDYTSIADAIARARPEYAVVATETAGHADVAARTRRCRFSRHGSGREAAVLAGRPGPRLSVCAAGRRLQSALPSGHDGVCRAAARTAGDHGLGLCRPGYPGLAAGTRSSHHGVGDRRGRRRRAARPQPRTGLSAMAVRAWHRVAALGGASGARQLEVDDHISLLLEMQGSQAVQVHMDYLDRPGMRKIRVNLRRRDASRPMFPADASPSMAPPREYSERARPELQGHAPRRDQGLAPICSLSGRARRHGSDRRQRTRAAVARSGYRHDPALHDMRARRLQGRGRQEQPRTARQAAAGMDHRAGPPDRPVRGDRLQQRFRSAAGDRAEGGCGYRGQAAGRDGDRHRAKTSGDPSLSRAGDRAHRNDARHFRRSRRDLAAAAAVRYRRRGRSSADNPAPAMSSPARRRTDRPISIWSRRARTAASALSKVVESAGHAPAGRAALFRHERIDLCLARCRRSSKIRRCSIRTPDCSRCRKNAPSISIPISILPWWNCCFASGWSPWRPNHDRIQETVRPQRAHRRRSPADAEFWGAVSPKALPNSAPMSRSSILMNNRSKAPHPTSSARHAAPVKGYACDITQPDAIRRVADGRSKPISARSRSCSTTPPARPAMSTRSLRRSRHFRWKPGGRSWRSISTACSTSPRFSEP